MFFHLSLEAWLAAAISCVIIKSGVEMLRSTLSELLGERADASLAREIEKTVCSFPEVLGAYDLVLNNYGPDSFIGSIHIEVPDTCAVDRLDELNRTITMAVYQKHGVLLAAIGVYSRNTKDPEAVRVHDDVTERVLRHEHIRQIHGFYLNREKMALRFDLVVSLDAKDRQAVYRAVVDEIAAAYPAYELQVSMDTDFAEE